MRSPAACGGPWLWGPDLGSNGTIIGASGNVVTVGMVEKAGYQISFLSYIEACFVPRLITVTLCMIYLLVAY